MELDNFTVMTRMDSPVHRRFGVARQKLSVKDIKISIWVLMVVACFSCIAKLAMRIHVEPLVRCYGRQEVNLVYIEDHIFNSYLIANIFQPSGNESGRALRS